MFPAFKNGPYLTFGSNELAPDVEWEWRKRLEKRRDLHASGWYSTISLEAFVIPIKGAARPEAKGLLHPLLQRRAGEGLGNGVQAGVTKGLITPLWSRAPFFIGWVDEGMIWGVPGVESSDSHTLVNSPAIDHCVATCRTPEHLVSCRYKAKCCSYFVFSLPAVHVRSDPGEGRWL